MLLICAYVYITTLRGRSNNINELYNGLIQSLYSKRLSTGNAPLYIYNNNYNLIDFAPRKGKRITFIKAGIHPKRERGGVLEYHIPPTYITSHIQYSYPETLSSAFYYHTRRLKRYSPPVPTNPKKFLFTQNRLLENFRKKLKS